MLLEEAEEVLVERGFGEGFLVLEFGREIDAIVLTDIADGLRRKLLGLGTDAHGVKNGPAGSKITGEGPW
jgi:hypothetical protein